MLTSQCTFQAHFTGPFPRITSKCVCSVVIKKHFSPMLRNSHASFSLTRAPRCELDYTPSFPLLFPAPLSTAKKEIIHFLPFLKTSPSPTNPSQQQTRHTDDHTLSQTLIVCARVSAFFPPDMKKEPE